MECAKNEGNWVHVAIFNYKIMESSSKVRLKRLPT